MKYAKESNKAIEDELLRYVYFSLVNRVNEGAASSIKPLTMMRNVNISHQFEFSTCINYDYYDYIMYLVML